MRKKDLIKLNEELFSRQQTILKQLEEVIEENKILQGKIKILEDNLKTAESQENTESPIKKLEEKMIANAQLTDEHKHGAKIIGKIVVLAAGHCNRLAISPSNNADTKELINLILGRTEIAKAEILNIVESNSEFIDKQNLIDAQLDECEDYFNSIMAQN